MKIINKATGAVLEAKEEIARGYLKNPAFVPYEPKKPTAQKPVKKGE